MVQSRKAKTAKNALIERFMLQARNALEREDHESAQRTIDWYFRELEGLDEETPLELIGIPSRVCRILEANDINSVELLCKISRDHLAELDDLGAMQIHNIVVCLRQNGLSLKKVV